MHGRKGRALGLCYVGSGRVDLAQANWEIAHLGDLEPESLKHRRGTAVAAAAAEIPRRERRSRRVPMSSAEYGFGVVAATLDQQLIGREGPKWYLSRNVAWPISSYSWTAASTCSARTRSHSPIYPVCQSDPAGCSPVLHSASAAAGRAEVAATVTACLTVAPETSPTTPQSEP